MNRSSSSRAAIIAQLDRILSSETFSHVERLKQFLRYVVHEAIEGRSDEIKEYSVGISVFDRDESFDPRLDPIVRVQAGRLRAKLSDYYESEGAEDPVRIDLPRGSYVPVFRRNERPPAAAVPPHEELKAVAVLPFADYSPGGDYEYFCEGLTSEVIHALMGLENVKVMSSPPVGGSRASRLKRIRQIAARYGATTVVDGNLRCSGDNLRITLHLVDAATGDVLWSNEWDRNATDIIALQEEVAHGVFEGLWGHAHASTIDYRSPRSTENVKAHRLYLRGRYHWNSRRNRSSFLRAVEYFERALAEDPQHALAYVGLSDSYAQLGTYDYMQPSVIGPKAIAAASAAAQIAPDTAEAHTSLGHAISLFEWDFKRAEEEFQRALSLNPRYPHAHTWYAMSCLVPQARMEEAIDELMLARPLDPVALVINLPARVHYLNRDYKAAEAACEETIELDPNHVTAYRILGLVAEQLGDLEKAEATFRKALSIEPQNMRVLGYLGRTLALAGREAEARKVLRSLARWEKKLYVSPFEAGFIYLTLGELDRGFDLLEEAYRHRCETLRILRLEPRFDAFRGHPRFKAFLEKIHNPHWLTERKSSEESTSGP